MLTIDRSLPLTNKMIVATAVFAIGFIGSLSTLRLLHSGSEQLLSGRENTVNTAAQTSQTSSTGEPSASGGSHGKANQNGSDTLTASTVNPVDTSLAQSPASDPVTQPVQTADGSSGSTTQASGQTSAVNPPSQPPSTAGPGSEPTVVGQAPTTTPAPAPAKPVPEPEPASPSAPLPSQPVAQIVGSPTDTVSGLVSSL